MNDTDAAGLKGAEHELVYVGLLDLAEVPGGGAEVRTGDSSSALSRQSIEPFRIAAHHWGSRTVSSGKAEFPIGGQPSVVPLSGFLQPQQHAASAAPRIVLSAIR